MCILLRIENGNSGEEDNREAHKQLFSRDCAANAFHLQPGQEQLHKKGGLPMALLRIKIMLKARVDL